MPTIGQYINMISDDLVLRLENADYPALTDGAILIGRQHVIEQSSPPRVVFVPVGSAYGPRNMYGPSNRANPTLEASAQILQRAIATETVKFEVHVWGQADPPDPEGGDFDATQFLYQALILSIHLTTVGSYKLGNGTWVDQAPSMAQFQKAGHEYVFTIDIDTPVMDGPLQYVQEGTVGSITVIEENTQTGTSSEIEVIILPP
jgi:hypothetical protein